MEAHYTTPLGPFAPAIGAVFASFTTKQDVSPLPLPVLPSHTGGAIDLGTILKIEAEGEFSTTGTPTLGLGLYAGVPGASGGGTITSTFADSSLITTGSNAASWPWRLEYRGKFVTLGIAGSIVGCGTLEFGTSLIAQTAVPIPITLALRTVAINTTVGNAIGVAAVFSASSASNIVKTYTITASLLN